MWPTGHGSHVLSVLRPGARSSCCPGTHTRVVVQTRSVLMVGGTAYTGGNTRNKSHDWV